MSTDIDFCFDEFNDKEDSFFDISELIQEVEEEDLRIEELQKEVFKAFPKFNYPLKCQN